jgi:hypothetical protein
VGIGAGFAGGDDIVPFEGGSDGVSDGVTRGSAGVGVGDGVGVVAAVCASMVAISVAAVVIPAMTSTATTIAETRNHVRFQSGLFGAAPGPSGGTSAMRTPLAFRMDDSLSHAGTPSEIT